jgi:hypothetical protein
MCIINKINMSKFDKVTSVAIPTILSGFLFLNTGCSRAANLELSASSPEQLTTELQNLTPDQIKKTTSLTAPGIAKFRSTVGSFGMEVGNTSLKPFVGSFNGLSGSRDARFSAYYQTPKKTFGSPGFDYVRALDGRVDNLPQPDGSFESTITLNLNDLVKSRLEATNCKDGAERTIYDSQELATLFRSLGSRENANAAAKNYSKQIITPDGKVCVYLYDGQTL